MKPYESADDTILRLGAILEEMLAHPSDYLMDDIYATVGEIQAAYLAQDIDREIIETIFNAHKSEGIGDEHRE